MQKSFPALAHLNLWWNSFDLSTPFPTIPGIFLGGSSQRLQRLRLGYISFPEFPAFLLSARSLISLKLKEIYNLGYISPGALVRGLAILTSLTTLSISFCDETSPSDQWRNHRGSQTRTVILVLTDFHYKGCSEYLENFLAQFDMPRLNEVKIKYYTRHFTWQMQVPQHSRFIDRT